MNFNRNSFYDYPLWVQWSVALLLLLCFLIACLGVVALILEDPLWALLTPLLIPVSQFTVSPLFTLLGLYRYLSPILHIYLPNRKSYELHHASSFDYLFLWQQLKHCPDRKRQILMYYLEGLINLIKLIEEKNVSPDVVIEGNTYFINKRTSQLIGLSLTRTGKFKKACLYLNFLDMLWMYSFTCKKLQLPSLSHSGYLKGNGHQLVANKHKLLGLYRRLKSANTEAVAVNGSAGFS
ncbi:hypothetical protein D770_03980 [Flammeovirgaceae bacterium 311]|nr:hypothetical protein D770_03980 [Flammeovirgaceae bacterium 311]